MSSGPITGFLLDSCVLLPQSLKATRDVCQNFLNKNSSHFVSSSVKNEVLQLLDRTGEVLNTSIRHYMKPALERYGITNVTKNDAITVADVFSQEKRRLGKEHPVRTGIRAEVFGEIEDYVANIIHELGPDRSISVDDLLATALNALSVAKYEMEKPFKSIKSMFVEPEAELLNFAPICKLVKNKHDVIHLMSAVKYQFQQNAWVIFVTNDEKEILSNSSDIWKFCGLHCTKPVWAFDYYDHITRLKRPRQYFGEVLIPPTELREFIKIIENTLNLQIRPKVI